MEPQQHMGPETNELKDIECILLAGGLGTRLRTAVPDLPKCMAPIGNHPFLKYLIDYLISNGVTKFIFALGYMHETIETFLKTDYPTLDYKISIENEPLGTGGAIYHALKIAREKDVLILNGDTMYSINLKELMNFHLQQHAICTLALKPMNNFDRYGVVEINKDNCIQSFKEKKFYENGLINGGVYVLNVIDFLATDFPVKFSFEKEFLEKYFATKKMCGLIQDDYFIDIGIPEDFEKARRELN